MLIGVISDTHGRIDRVLQALQRYPIRQFLFLGDFYHDGIKLMQKLGIPGCAVAGNCDHMPEEKLKEAVIEIEGVRFFLTHGHTWGVKQGTARLQEYASTARNDVVLFGHTHRSYLKQEEGFWLMNPGSAAISRNQEDPSIGLIEISLNQIEFSILSVLDHSLINGNVAQRRPVS